MKSALSIVLSIIGGPALSLSCLAPDVAYTFAELSERPETYVVVHGSLVFDETLLPITDWDNQAATPSETMIPARLTGASLTRDGFTAAFDRDITFNAACAGPWCVSATSGPELLAFVEIRDGEYVFELGPCYFQGFFEPDAAVLDAAVSCMRGSSCDPKGR